MNKLRDGQRCWRGPVGMFQQWNNGHGNGMQKHQHKRFWKDMCGEAYSPPASFTAGQRHLNDRLADFADGDNEAETAEPSKAQQATLKALKARA